MAVVDDMPSFWLASASPRRRALLEQLGLRFRVVPSAVVEMARAPSEAPTAYASRLAAEKAADVATTAASAGLVVLGADTIVVVDDEVLGKPRNVEHAVEMLMKLQGREHMVITGVELRRGSGDLHSGVSIATSVRFRAFDEGLAQRYVARGESHDKAGSYAIQGFGAGLVESIHGSYTNVVGLPVVETLALLTDAGVIAPGAWP